ncbi:putative GIY-YIG superfamily endonuclease [Alkalibacillus flavidus]|uniref:GIY-YIG superfamily endonuclease n=1 Tax=Alkalibacillus flavidus TaxID=546021 RepID=A0ABV2KXV5_9BACI
MLQNNIKYLPNDHVPELAGVYILEDTESGHVYIGSSINMRSRIAHHRSLLQMNKHPNKQLQALFLEGNLIFKVLVSFPVPDKHKVKEAEQLFIEASPALFEQELVNRKPARAFHLINH